MNMSENGETKRGSVAVDNTQYEGESFIFKSIINHPYIPIDLYSPIVMVTYRIYAPASLCDT